MQTHPWSRLRFLHRITCHTGVEKTPGQTCWYLQWFRWQSTRFWKILRMVQPPSVQIHYATQKKTCRSTFSVQYWTIQIKPPSIHGQSSQLMIFILFCLTSIAILPDVLFFLCICWLLIYIFFNSTRFYNVQYLSFSLMLLCIMI